MSLYGFTPTRRTAAEVRASLAMLNRQPTAAERWILNADRTRNEREQAVAELAQVEAARLDAAARRPVSSTMADAELRDLAKRRAQLMADAIDAIAVPMTPAGLLEWLNARVKPLQGRPFRLEGDRPEADQLRGMLARARCAAWWRRNLRRVCVRMREAEGRAAGEISARRRQVYVTNDTARRHEQRRADTAAMMAATELESDAGQVATLAELAAASTSNPTIRRGELMTRIRGCEGIAEAFGWRGVFLTLTTPSRFHAVHRHGERNDKHAGATPRDAHEWLCSTWAKARARLHRMGLQTFGFRVAEPHHDGTPHWHALLWVRPGQLWRVVLAIVRQWRTLERRPMTPIHAEGCRGRSGWAEKRGGIFTDLGARRHRVKAVAMNPGGASGYIAKYIAKGIDDAGAVGLEGHRDDDGDAQRDMIGGTAKRVAAWASAWGIRQFQGIGQPPVTVWRELRRIPEQARGGATPRLEVAFEAVDRQGERRADWARYVVAQGGVCVGRDYLIRLERAAKVIAGRYETHEVMTPIGVSDSSGPGDLHLSDRREWRPRGGWQGMMSAKAVGGLAAAAGGGGAVRRPPGGAPWTRVNNCTGAVVIDGRRVDFAGIIRRAARTKAPPMQTSGEVGTFNGTRPCPGTSPPSSPTRPPHSPPAQSRANSTPGSSSPSRR